MDQTKLVQELVARIRGLCRMLLVVSAMLVFTSGLCIWLSFQCRHFAAEAVRAQEAHCRTLDEQEAFLRRVNANLTRGDGKWK